MKTIKNPQWGTTQDLIEEWRRKVLIVTTTKYHNLVIHWNTWTLPQGAKDLTNEMESTMYHLMDDKATDPFVILLVSEHSSKK